MVMSRIENTKQEILWKNIGSIILPLGGSVLLYQFNGYYYKHQKGDKTLCIIVGQSGSDHFIQVITNDFSEKVPFTKGNRFSTRGIKLNIQSPKLSLYGVIQYKNLSPIQYDIMGPFRIIPMECKHKIISMRHSLEGEVVLNGETIDFTGGTGYIEQDSGRSFPAGYVWVQANDFEEPCAIMAAVASIPLYALRFRGCICIVQYKGKEYRFATYLGVKIIACTKNRIFLEQGKYRLEIRLKERNPQPLRAPKDGKMTRTIKESVSCHAEFRFYQEGNLIFRLQSRHTGFEYEGKREK